MNSEPCPICQAVNPPSSPVCGSCGASLAFAPNLDSLPVGASLKSDEYRIERVLGQGGFGITYLASQRRLNRPVAIKEFFPSGCRRQGRMAQAGGSINPADFIAARSKFLQEAMNLSQFRHLGIVQIFDRFEENDTAYMVMEYLKGVTLAQALEERGGSLPERDAVNYMVQAAEALKIVHGAHLLHRDIKPDNIILTDEGRVVLIDFGAARAFVAGKTQSHSMMLTPGYAPLEQFGQHAKFGPYTDIYALGATLYHLLTGAMPVSAPDRASGVDLPPIREINPTASEETERAVTAAMEIPVIKRPQMIDEWLDLLRTPIPRNAPQPIPPSPSPVPSSRSANLILAILMSFLLLMGCFMAYAFRHGMREDESHRREPKISYPLPSGHSSRSDPFDRRTDADERHTDSDDDDGRAESHQSKSHQEIQ